MAPPTSKANPRLISHSTGGSGTAAADTPALLARILSASVVPTELPLKDEECATSEWESRLENASEVAGNADSMKTMIRAR